MGVNRVLYAVGFCLYEQPQISLPAAVSGCAYKWAEQKSNESEQEQIMDHY
jgi:hypothetical protein